ncbi:hypothetical protein [Deferrisoma sp.]
MTTRRNKELDRRETIAQIRDPSLRGAGRPDPVSWLGHRGGAGQIDYLLLEGATWEQMEAARGGVEGHLRHLKLDHGLPIRREGSRFLFDREALGITGSVSRPAVPRYPGVGEVRDALAALRRKGTRELRIPVSQLLDALAARDPGWQPDWRQHVRRNLGAWLAQLSREGEEG